MPINKEQGAGLPARIDRLSRTDKFGCAVGELESGVSKNSARGPGSAKRAPIRLSFFACLFRFCIDRKSMIIWGIFYL